MPFSAIFDLMEMLLEKALIASVFALQFLFLSPVVVLAQCPPTISLSTASASISINDFGDITAGVTRNGITNISINSGCDWDLFAEATLVQNVDFTPAQGVVLPLSAIDIRAFNLCETPNHDYGLGSPPPPPRISNTLAAAFTGGRSYIVGTAPLPPGEDGPIAKAPGPCPATVINGAGTAAVNPTTHTFRIDIRVTPGIVPVVKPGLYDLTINFSAMDDVTGVFNLTSFTLEIEILPILQLKMSTSDQLDFVFSDITDYAAGITRSGATILTVSSSLDWDLMAVGTSSLNESTSGASAFWDQNLSYSALGSASIPLGVLELHQFPTNPAGGGPGVDYGPAFTTPPSGNNYVEVGYQGVGGAIVFSLPSTGDKTIAGNWGDATAGNSVAPGGYLPVVGGGPTSDYRYVISYRITPGLPVRFNGLMVGVDAQPGYYTMQVRYLLTEDQ
ncbi:MAG: hypothetical protein JKY52_16060 [Flavobacteriales bacterium]|nr:hypothetical protein [Flavobacteriales bacterium]